MRICRNCGREQPTSCYPVLASGRTSLLCADCRIAPVAPDGLARCRRCGLVRPAASFRWNGVGQTVVCAVCWAAKALATRAARRARVAAARGWNGATAARLGAGAVLSTADSRAIVAAQLD